MSALNQSKGIALSHPETPEKSRGRRNRIAALIFLHSESMLPTLLRISILSVIIGIALSVSALAQTAGITVGTASGIPGATVSFPVSFTPGAAAVSTVQFDLMFSSSVSSGAISAGAAANSASKSAMSSVIPGGVRILISELNQNSIGSGILATVQMTISSSAAAGSVHPITLSGIVAASPAAAQVAISGVAGSIAVVAPSDTTPPSIISSVTATSTSTGATIAWTTNEASTSIVDYGLTTSRGTIVSNTSRVTNHSVALTGLTVGTTYYYRVTSADAAGNSTNSATFSFSTLADTTAPTISGVTVSNITGTGATISWTTSEAANTQIEYGTTTSYGSSTPLAGAMTTSHSQTLSGLTEKTTYCYRVNSADAAGNAGHATGSFATTTTADSTPPVISGVTTSTITGTTATVTWTTNEPADSQVDFGTRSNYDKSTSATSTFVTSHSQMITGLTANTRYHYRAKSKDAAGNLGASTDLTFRTATNSTPPVISAISVTNVSGTSVVITWTTDKPADSEVSYWIDGASARKAAVRTLETSHSITLSKLKTDTIYHYIVKSTDADGNQTAAPELTFSTAQVSATTSLSFARFSSGDNVLGTDTMVGLGLANLSEEPTTLTFTASEDDGNLTSGENITNPVVSELAAGEQLPILDWEVFGSGLLKHKSNGWVKLETSNAETKGFFLIFDSGLSMMDGANFSDAKLTDFAFTEIQPDGYNKISIINNNPEKSDLTIDLVAADGTVRSSLTRMIKKNGALTADLFNDLFVGILPNTSDYVRVKSSIGVQSLQVMRQKTGDVSTLAGQDISASDSTLYSPQYAWGGPWRTSLSIINLDSTAGSVVLRFFGEDGLQIGQSQYLPISANGKVFIDDPSFFTTTDPKAVTAGYIEIVANGIRVAGSTVFGDINRQTSCSAMALVSTLQTNLLFSHVASNDMYFTGIAILNPNSSDAVVTLELYASDGTRLKTKNVQIGAKQRISRGLEEYFTLLAGKAQTSGYVRLKSYLPIAAFALFGTKDYTTLSAIPPLAIQ